jgi:hypothetical protein
MDKLKENERAERLALRISNYNSVLANVYDNIVDRDFNKVETDVKFIIMEMRCILKSIEEDDF